MSGPMSLREARTKQQKEKTYKNSRLRFRASMKPTRNERSPSEHGDEKNTRRKKIMKVDNTEGEGSDVNMGASGTEELKITISAEGDVEMSGLVGGEAAAAKEGSSADPVVKETEDDDPENISIEKAMEKVCGEPAQPDEKEAGTEDEGSEDSLMPDEGNREESPTFTDEEIYKKPYGEASGDEDTSEENSKQEAGTGDDLPIFKDEEVEKPKDKKKENKKKRPRKDDDDSDGEGNEDGKKPGKGKKKDKDDDGHGSGDKPDGDNEKDKDGDASGSDKPAGGEEKDGDDKDGGDNQKGGNEENSDDSDGDIDMGGNGDEDKNASDDDDLDDLGGSSEDGGSGNDGSDVEESENSLVLETEVEITDDDESEADSAAGKGIGGLNITEDNIGGIIFDRGEGGGGNGEGSKNTSDEMEKISDIDFAGAIDPYDVESDIDEPSIDEDYCEFLSQDGGSGGEDDNSYYGDDDYLEEVEEVRGTG